MSRDSPRSRDEAAIWRDVDRCGRLIDRGRVREALDLARSTRTRAVGVLREEELADLDQVVAGCQDSVEWLESARVWKRGLIQPYFLFHRWWRRVLVAVGCLLVLAVIAGGSSDEGDGGSTGDATRQTEGERPASPPSARIPDAALADAKAQVILAVRSGLETTALGGSSGAIVEVECDRGGGTTITCEGAIEDTVSGAYQGFSAIGEYDPETGTVSIDPDTPIVP